MHQPADGDVGHQQAPEFLLHQLRRLAPEHNLSATQVRLQLVERVLYLPALMIKRSRDSSGDRSHREPLRYQLSLGPRVIALPRYLQIGLEAKTSLRELRTNILDHLGP